MHNALLALSEVSTPDISITVENNRLYIFTLPSLIVGVSISNLLALPNLLKFGKFPTPHHYCHLPPSPNLTESE